MGWAFFNIAEIVGRTVVVFQVARARFFRDQTIDIIILFYLPRSPRLPFFFVLPCRTRIVSYICRDAL